MSDFVIQPLASEIAAQVRSTMRSPNYGHPVHREVAHGTGPCRECLSAFSIGSEERLLFTHNPFVGSARTPQPGPVFIHAEPCRPHAGGGYPEGLRALPVLAEPHHVDGGRSAPSPLIAGEEDETLRRLLDSPTVSFLHLRHAEAGCFIARVDRAD